MRLTQLIRALNTQAVPEYNLMEKFAKEDVADINAFWAHPESGQIFRFEGTHTANALEPSSPIGLDPNDFQELEHDDFAVFRAAFNKGWVRSAYLVGTPNSPMGNQLALHGPNQRIVRLALWHLLDTGLDVDYVGLRGQFDGFEYDGPLDAMNA